MCDNENKMMEIEPEKKKKMAETIKGFGVDESIIDEDLMIIFKKVDHKINKLRFMLDKKGVIEKDVRGIVDKAINNTFMKSLGDVKEWHETHMNNVADKCCDHCSGCHHNHENHEIM